MSFVFKDIGYRYRSGAVRLNDLCYVLCIDPGLQEAGLPHTSFYAYDCGLWGMYDIGRFDAHSLCVVQQPKQQAIGLGACGTVRVMGNNDDYDEYISVSGVSLSTLRSINCIGGYAYVCGMDRQVFKRLAPGEWVALHGDMPEQPADDLVFGFEAIHGFSESDLYAVGWHGEIWYRDGERWQRCVSPVSSILSDVHCAGDGWAYACGRNGVLLKGRAGQWTAIKHDRDGTDFWSLNWFQGQLYVASLTALYVLDGEALRLVDTGDVTPRSCHRLSSADGLLWSVGADDILSFDGVSWSRVE
ncbi:hypothetical protein [Pseudomonas sp.]|uniref:hypothetical protein n=1 Tax=Pseudomonas sp. TaxID=306 RepID=UPI003D114D85